MRSFVEKRHIRRIHRIVARYIKPLVVVRFWYVRWRTHNQFLLWLRNDQIGKPSVLAFPFVYYYRGCTFLKRIWQTEFSDYALRRYQAYLALHYSPTGVGYFDYTALSDESRVSIFNGLSSRLAHYVDYNRTILDYKDGETFLDAGCGKGQNIKELISRYPRSVIKGFDINEGALQVVGAALKDSPNVHVELGSIVDPTYLSSYPDHSIDHVVVSHVISFLSSSSLDETRTLRQTVIDQLLRIARRTLIIMDANIWSDSGSFEVIMDQNTRCFFRESLQPYFSKYQDIGELYLMVSSDDMAFAFKKFETNTFDHHEN